ncbi:MAG: DUF1573 domain-containing protein [Planctomycetota bacterium]
MIKALVLQPVYLPCLALAFFATTTVASAQGAASAGPVVQLVEQEYFGSYFRGEVFTRKVKVGNGGSAPLEILRVNSKCGCARSIGFDSSIAPGEQGTFELEVNTSSVKPGRWGKRISVFTNDASKPVAVFYFNIEIRELVRTDPQELVIAGPYGEAKQLAANVLAATETGFTLTGVQAKNDTFTVTQERVADNHYKLLLSAGAAAQRGRQNGLVTLTLQSADGRKLTRSLPVAVKHQDYLSVKPDKMLRFHNRTTAALLRDGARPIRRTITLSATSTSQEFEVVSVKVEGGDGAFATELRTLDPKRAYEIDVVISEYQTTTFVKGKVVIATTVPQSPKIEIEVQAIFGRRNAPRKDSGSG